MTKQINLKSESWCVKNDGSQLFKKTVVKWLNENYEADYSGENSLGSWYGVNNSHQHISCIGYFGTVLTLSEFIELAKEQTEFFCHSYTDDLGRCDRQCDNCAKSVDVLEFGNTYEAVNIKPTEKSEPARDGWVSVKDRMPEKQCHCLVVAPKSFPKNCMMMVAEFYEDNGIFYSEDGDYPMEDVTHWQHLPELPKQ